MSKKKMVILFGAIVLVIVALALTTSYALFNINVTRNSIFKTAVGNLELTINDNGNTFNNGKFVINGMIPTKESVAMQESGYSFSITNTGTVDAGYSIYIDDVVLSSLPTGITGRLDNTLVNVALTNTTTNITHTFRLANIPERLLETGTLDAQESNNFVLRIWLDYAAGNEAQNKYFAAKLRVQGVQKNTLAIAGLYDEDDNLIESYDNLVSKYGFNPATWDGYDYYYDEGWHLTDDDSAIEFSSIPTYIPYATLNREEYSNATKLILPEGITQIMDNAFQYLTNIKVIEIPSTVTYVGEYAFAKSSSIEEIIFADNSMLTSFSDDSFTDCINLKHIKLPTSLKYLGYSFDGCENLESLEIPASVTEILSIGGNYPNLKTVTFAENSRLKTIGSCAFQNFTALESIEIPASVTKIEKNAFRYDEELTSVTFASNNTLKSIGEYAFADTNLGTIEIPVSVTSIGDSAFAGIYDVYYDGPAEDGLPWGAYNIIFNDED